MCCRLTVSPNYKSCELTANLGWRGGHFCVLLLSLHISYKTPAVPHAIHRISSEITVIIPVSAAIQNIVASLL